MTSQPLSAPTIVVRKDGFKLEGGELFKEGFRKHFKTIMNLSHELIDSAIQLAKTAAKAVVPEKQSVVS